MGPRSVKRCPVLLRRSFRVGIRLANVTLPEGKVAVDSDLSARSAPAQVFVALHDGVALCISVSGLAVANFKASINRSVVTNN